MSDALAKYDFLPWLRRGAAAQLGNADPLKGALPRRGALTATLTIDSTGGPAPTADTVTASVELLGPGDVVGIDPRHVIRTDPPNLTVNFEPNYLAAIEFDHPHFPWQHTPAAPAPISGSKETTPRRLRPWLVLVVLADEEFNPAGRSPTPLPAIVVADAKTLPNLDESWAWAHAQVAGGVGAADLSELLTNEPARATSRLICPRRLLPKTHYTAFLVPAFDLGVAAGLGDKPPSDTAAKPAWDAATANRTLPYYYRFEFHTSEFGDFGSLARKLKSRKLPAEVGMRPVAVDKPGWGMPDPGGPLGLGGALRSLSTADTPWTGPKREAFRQRLEQSLNKGVVLDGPDDPIVTPPIYGRWHAAVTSVDRTRSGWVNELNLDPRTRSMAGFGSRVVLDQRSQLLAAAWAQVDGLIEANRRLRHAQLAREASARLHAKHLQPADPDRVLTLTAAVHKRLLASPLTVHATVARSRLPVAALSSTLRRLTRPGGRLAQHLGPAPVGAASFVTSLNSGEVTPIPPPARVIGLEDVADSFLPRWLPRGLWPLLPYAARILLGLALVSAFAILLVGWLLGWWPQATALAGAVAGALGAVAAAALKLRRRWVAGIRVRFAKLTPGALAAAPPAPEFHPGQAGKDSPPPTGAVGPDSPEAQRFRSAATRLAETLQMPTPEPPAPKPVDLPGLSETVLQRLNPATTIPARVARLIHIDERLQWDKRGDPLDTIMAAPEFPQPMYRPLRDLSQQLLMPGLDHMPPDTLGLLNESHAFIEAYMLGLNHEMARQLLLDGYPTDQRGSYFRQFWDVSGYVPAPDDPTDSGQLLEQLKDIPPLHQWPRAGALGQNRNRPPTRPGSLVLIVRGELLLRYPNATIYAAEAKLKNGQRVLGDKELHPLFKATLDPDVTLLGFDLTEQEARGSHETGKPQGWFFVFQQNPSAPHFGLEPAPDPYAVRQISAWDQLSWANFAPTAGDLKKIVFLSPAAKPQVVPDPMPENPNVNPGDGANHWGRDSAQTAYIALVRPVRIAIHADLMLP